MFIVSQLHNRLSSKHQVDRTNQLRHWDPRNGSKQSQLALLMLGCLREKDQSKIHEKYMCVSSTNGFIQKWSTTLFLLLHDIFGPIYKNIWSKWCCFQNSILGEQTEQTSDGWTFTTPRLRHQTWPSGRTQTSQRPGLNSMPWAGFTLSERTNGAFLLISWRRCEGLYPNTS